MSINEWVALAFVVVAVVLLVINGIRNRNQTRELSANPLFRDMSSEIGLVAEQGTAVHIALGNGGLLDANSMVSLASLQALDGLTDLAAAYDTPPLISTGNPTLYLLADNWMRRAYARSGSVENYNPNLVTFTASTPLTFAADAAAKLGDEKVSTGIMLGTFDSEMSLFADAARKQQVKMYGGAVSMSGLAALYPALEEKYLVMGEALFTGAAEVSTRSIFSASLHTQNALRWIVIVGIGITAVLSLFG